MLRATDKQVEERVMPPRRETIELGHLGGREVADKGCFDESARSCDCSSFGDGALYRRRCGSRATRFVENAGHGHEALDDIGCRRAEALVQEAPRL